MPYATNDGVRIYYEREGSGPPLLLHCGFPPTLNLWRDWGGYPAALRDHYTLLLLDPRGQGRSDKPHDPAAYSYDRRVGDTLTVLDHAGVDTAIFWGYSMGGRVGFAAARDAPARFRAFIVGGMHPEAPDRAVQEEEVAALRGGMAGYVALLEREGGQLPTDARAWIMDNDAAALAASASATAEAPDFRDTLARLDVPMLVYAGERDVPFHERARRAVAGLPRVMFVSLPGLGHMEAFARSDLVLPHVRTFLADLHERAERT